jgi:succinate dehydrogenase hydrophobic anchor subunit
MVFAYFYTSDTELAHWTAKIKEPIWKMLAALTVDIVTLTTVWSMSTILQYSILSLYKNNFKLIKFKLEYDHFIISVFKKVELSDLSHIL